MTAPLHERFGLGQRELVSIVGAGGKSTTMFTLGRELAAEQHRVIVTTTTKLAVEQAGEPALWTDGSSDVEAALVAGQALFVAAEHIPEKVTGPTPEAVDRLFAETTADYIIVEADGARSLLIKAPEEHEPVIPSTSTMVVVVAALDALGQPISDVAHRPELVARLAGSRPDAVLTVEGAARVLLHPEGGLKGIPVNARVVMALTKLTWEERDTAAELISILTTHPRVDRVVPIPLIR
ncbi:MAG: selenium cofactor biosynthesis protein YqeC [Actinomycetota bacterium]